MTAGRPIYSPEGYRYTYNLVRRGSRIQKGGVVHSEGGGGGSYRNFRSGSKLLQDPGQITKQEKLQTAVGGGSDHPPKNLYPRLLVYT